MCATLCQLFWKCSGMNFYRGDGISEHLTAENVA